MRLLHLLLTVGLAMLVQADRMSTEFKTHAVDAFVIKDFLIYNIVSTEWRDHSTRLTNRNITCMLSTYASALDFIADLTWSSLLTQTPTRLPSARMDGPNLGFSAFRFKTYDSPGKFELQITHSFSDPNHYPPPYNYVQYFAPATVELDCGRSRNTNRCVRPGPIRGIINQITN
ncbi:uncharacterized protein RAG0_08099 [Rhynchosporium agropyri]|uniref:AA1-like domain-containing protein n=1 Tax=Rhynchosporium agropyri TaxID=914238 RepID=A0A1E1KP24_9HELO|nr:uncharacterized protein RAG0_08099 [Rhynchosporium agropyri]